MKSYLSKYKSKVKNHFWLPPGVDTSVIKPRLVHKCNEALNLLEKRKNLSRKEILNLLRNNIMFLEMSRTARAKQKDMVLKAYRKMVHRDRAILVMNVDPTTEIYQDVKNAYYDIEDRKKIFLVEKFIPRKAAAQLFSLAKVFVTPSISDPWGMSAQEAAASKTAIISFKNVAFANEILKDNALLVHKHASRLYAEKMDILVRETHLRRKLANKSYKLVASHYSWDALGRNLIDDMKSKNLIH